MNDGLMVFDLHLRRLPIDHFATAPSGIQPPASGRLKNVSEQGQRGCGE
jgi:hypothetical protein